MEALKPCPFCGADMEIRMRSVATGENTDDRCKPVGDHADGCPLDGVDFDWFENVAELTWTWNTREVE